MLHQLQPQLPLQADVVQPQPQPPLQAMLLLPRLLQPPATQQPQQLLLQLQVPMQLLQLPQQRLLQGVVAQERTAQRELLLQLLGPLLLQLLPLVLWLLQQVI